MPEFHIDLGEQANLFCCLDAFTQGYIEAAFWTESGEPENACYDKNLGDLSPETLAEMIVDCRDFQALARRSLDLAYDYTTADYDARRAGVDFWLTRNRHGAGFWDRGLGTVGEKLTKDAHSYSEVNLVCGGDGLIYSY